jgi:hypothetical protein
MLGAKAAKNFESLQPKNGDRTLGERLSKGRRRGGGQRAFVGVRLEAPAPFEAMNINTLSAG